MFSDGPDRLRLSPICREHHNAVRTGHRDYECCCNPCLYVKGSFGSIDGFSRTCCRCVPQVIRLEFIGEGECCRTIGVPMFVQLLTNNEFGDDTIDTALYTGSLFDIQVIVTLGMRSEYDRTCVWRIQIPDLYVDEEVEIDHVNTTCLAVPSISIDGVGGFGGTCTGSLQLRDHTRIKVPFSKREFYPHDPHVIEAVETCGACDALCRVLWVRGIKRPAEAGSWSFSEFVWDATFVNSGNWKGQWVGPERSGGGTEKLRLWEDPDDGHCELRFLLEDDTGENDYFAPIAINTGSKCGCDFHEETYPVNTEGADLQLVVSCSLCRTLCVQGKRHTTGVSAFVNEWVEFQFDDDFVPYGDLIATWTFENPAGPNESIGLKQDLDTGELSFTFFFEDNTGENENFADLPLADGRCQCLIRQSTSAVVGIEILAINIRCGPCTCWQRACNGCRCVNDEMCVVGFIANEFFPPVTIYWDEASHCWTGGGVTVCLGSDESGDCTIAVSADGYESVSFDPVKSSTICGQFGSFGVTKIDEETGFSWLVGSSHTGGCQLSPCSDATPCSANCGSHPETLHVELRAWNDPYQDEPGFDDECLVNVDVHYWQYYADTGTIPPEVNCGYRGYKYFPTCGPFTFPFILEVEIRFGTITTRQYVNGSITPSNEFSAPFDIEECVPYFARVNETQTGVNGCLWSNCPLTVQRHEITVTE